MVKSGSMEENVFLTSKNSSAVPEITIKKFYWEKASESFIKPPDKKTLM